MLLQRKGNLLDVNELQDEAEDIFYGDQVPLDKIISKVQQMEECEDTCDVTKRLMQGVYPATNSNKYDLNNHASDIDIHNLSMPNSNPVTTYSLEQCSINAINY